MTSDPAPAQESVSPAAALAAHAALHPVRPFLFWPEGLDWRWMSFAEAVGEVERLRQGEGAGAVEERGVPPAVVELLEQIAGEGGVAGGAARGGGGVAGAGDLLAAAAPEPAPAAGRERTRQEVVVLAPPFDDEGCRRLLDWAVLAGAAVVVEPSRAGLVATATWARPSVFRGTAAEIAALAGAAAAAERAGFAGWWRRLRRGLGGDPPLPRPFGRLHTLLVAGGAAEAVDLAFWRARGARVVAGVGTAE